MTLKKKWKRENKNKKEKGNKKKAKTEKKIESEEGKRPAPDPSFMGRAGQHQIHEKSK
jgi:hypothetical protein